MYESVLDFTNGKRGLRHNFSVVIVTVFFIFDDKCRSSQKVYDAVRLHYRKNSYVADTCLVSQKACATLKY